MSLLGKILGKQKPRQIEDADFGPLHQIGDGWEGNNLALWDSSGMQVLIGTGEQGPSEEQRQFLLTLRGERAALRGRIEEAVTQHAAETTAVRPIVLHLRSLYIPKIEPHFTWRLWYDVEGEDHYWYGVEITDWERIVPFTED